MNADERFRTIWLHRKQLIIPVGLQYILCKYNCHW